MTETELISDERTFCAVHPDRETALRCNKCGRFMCVQCAVQTPVGYRCRECVRGIQDKFYTAETPDYVRVVLACAILAGAATALVSFIGIPLLFLIILGLPLGGVIAEASVRLVSKRRGRGIDRIAAASAAVGGLIGAVVPVIVQYNQVVGEIVRQSGVRAQDLPPLTLDTLLQMLFNDWATLIFIALIAAAVYGRYRMRS
jgi:hypothetical protein